MCLLCLDEAVYTLFDPARERAEQEHAEEILRDADAEIKRAKADGTDHFTEE